VGGYEEGRGESEKKGKGGRGDRGRRLGSLMASAMHSGSSGLNLSSG